MKKIIVNIMVLLIILCVAGTVYAEELQFKVNIEISSNVTEVSAGDKVTFTFVSRDIENSALDGRVGGIEGQISFDTNFFEYDTCSGFEYNAANNKFISFSFTGEGGTNGTITLKVKEGAQGTSTVKFSQIVASDGRETENADTLGTARTPDQEFAISLKKVEEVTPPAEDKTENEVIPPADNNTENEVNNAPVNKEDNTTTNGTKLPQTGIGFTLLVSILGVVAISAFVYSKYGKLKDIK